MNALPRATALTRCSGVQLHLTSLPDGRLGRSAFEFVDWLAAAGQSWWQVLPLGPPDRYGSPYKARSAFAAWPALLADRRARVSASDIAGFCDANAFWIEDWERLAGRGSVADQVRFAREWSELCGYAEQRGVRMFGDVAIYVAPGSVDQRAHPELFQAGLVAGAPPDGYSATGQLWGNPLYDWPALRRRGYWWWIERLRRTMSLFAIARIDHFRGFVSYWAVPAGDRTAARGRWKRGPGRALFDAAERELGSLPLVAEDLGVITPAVDRLREDLGLPGMVVLQFAFDPAEPDSPHAPSRHVENSVVYTGTHDHDTARGWYESLNAGRRAALRAELSARGIRERQPWWAMIHLALASPARVAMMQAQDVLGLGSEARMNKPGSSTGSWRWRMEPGALTASMARRLWEMTAEAGRLVS